jgi:hypothetical protein
MASPNRYAMMIAGLTSFVLEQVTVVPSAKHGEVFLILENKIRPGRYILFI